MTSPTPPGRDRTAWALAAAVAVASLIVFSGTLRNDFILLDTPYYVTQTDWIQEGLHAENLRLAFVRPLGGYLQPLTALSHMLDCQLFGLDPRGHHATNLLLHALNAALLLLALAALTGRPGLAAAVAALFAVHPLRVESVAWIAERKELLSAGFGFAALWAWAGWGQRRSRTSYVLCLLLTACSLLSKPTLVTMPFLLLLLDAWPLGRFRVERPALRRGRAAALWVEKLPFFVLSVLSSIVTLRTQSAAGAVATVEFLTLLERLWKAALAYALYLWKIAWPADLSVFYPIAYERLTAAWGLAALALLDAATLGAFRLRRHRPYLLVGWLWFVGTLVPTIGIVQAGSQMIADRFVYIPTVGLLLAGVFAVADRAHGVWQRRAATAALLAALLVLSASSAAYVEHWRSSETLFRHSLRSVGDVPLLRRWLARALERDGRYAEALAEYDRSASGAPSAPTLVWRAALLRRMDRETEASAVYAEALALTPSEAARQRASILVALGELAMDAGRTEEAAARFHEALALAPGLAAAVCGQARALAATGRVRDAVTTLERALADHPDDAELNQQLAWLLATRRDPALRDFEAVRRSVRRARGGNLSLRVALLDALAAAHAAEGRYDRAVQLAERALHLAGRGPAEDRELARRVGEIEARRRLYASGAPFFEDPAASIDARPSERAR